MSGEGGKESGAFTALVDVSSPKQVVSPTNLEQNKKPVPSRAQTEEFLTSQHNVKAAKEYIRLNNWSVDHPARCVLWQDICCRLLTLKRSPNIYTDTVTELFGQGQGATDDYVLPSFVQPALMHAYFLTPAGLDAARRVVIIIGHVFPDITYGPTIFSLVSLFLHYTNEQTCFECISNILRNEQKYIPQTRIAYEATTYILKDLAKKYTKSWYQTMMKSNISIENVLTDWQWWIFRDLPFAYMIRVVDCYLAEGPKVLYRVALSILALHHKRTASGKVGVASDAAAVTSSIRKFCSEMPVSADKLLQAAFSIRGLSRTEVRSIVVRNETFVASLQHAGNNDASVKDSQLSEPDGRGEGQTNNGRESKEVHKLTLKSIDTVRKRVQYNSQSNDPISTSHSYGIGGPFPSNGIVSFEQVVEVTADMSCLTLPRSYILTTFNSRTLMSWLPARLTLQKPQLLFTTLEHGNSITTFFHMVEGKGPTLMVIKTVSNTVFGAFCSADWEDRKLDVGKYFGTGETFVFTLEPERKRYDWVGRRGIDKPGVTNLFMFGDGTRLCIGGGKGIAIILMSDLAKGRTEPCLTFDNSSLTPGEDFECAALEVFGFV